MTREAIYTALFARLQEAYAWNTSSRVLLHWSDVDAIQQPAMFQTQTGEVVQRITRQPAKLMMSVKVYLYAHSQTAAGRAPASVLNDLVDAVFAAMAPNAPGLETQTLGGLVEWARIEGSIETDEGLLGDQAVAIVPITILTTA